MHSLLWGELLSVDNVSFNNFEELDVGMKLLAPWYSPNNTSDWVRLAGATIVEEKKENS